VAYSDLREWISVLDKAGELERVRAEVDPILEITEITDRMSKGGPRSKHGPGGPALLFENVKGYPGAKVLINQFGSERRMRLALEVDSLEEIPARIRMFMDVKSPLGFLDKRKRSRPGLAKKSSRRATSHYSISRYCNAGQRMAGVSSRCRR
jgi:4-hydroxy-3-polyprenylbenzoate decarboxylase